MPRFLLSHNMPLGKTSEKGIHMNIITSLLDIEDNDLELLSCEVQGFCSSEYHIFVQFGNLLRKYKNPIINSFIMVDSLGPDGIYNSRLSNGPIESLNRKVKDLKRLGRGFRNFEHMRNRFLFATRKNPIYKG